MHDEIQMPAVHIAPEHQSAPAEDYADKALTIARQELYDGTYTPTKGEGAEEYFYCGATQDIYDHPAVVEALARMEREKKDAPNSQEFLEKSEMLYEANYNLSKRDKWKGQHRWEGAQAEEMRRGEVLSPFQFLKRLTDVVGPERIMLNRFGVRPSPQCESARIALIVPDPDPHEDMAAMTLRHRIGRLEHDLLLAEQDFQGVRDIAKKGRMARRIKIITEQLAEAAGQQQQQQTRHYLQVGTLQYPLSTEWMCMRFNAFGVPTSAKYLGWRTALLSMIRLRVITEKEAHRAFPMGTGRAGNWYREQLFAIRNGTIAGNG